jgi:hypothetical protein
VRARARLLLAALVVLAWAAGAGAQPVSPPLRATQTLKPPVPPGAVYGETAPIPLVLELENVSGAPVTTAEGFLATPLWRRLFFTDQRGGITANTAEAPSAHAGHRVYHCLSRQGVLLRPTALPVVPVEVIPLAGATPGEAVLRYEIDDARQFYALGPGRYTVDARVPLLTFRVDGDAVFADCDQMEDQTVANLAALTAGDAFTIASNPVQFAIASPLSFRFRNPLVADAQCPDAATTPCKSLKLGKVLKVQLDLEDAAGAVVPGATVRIALTKVGGGAAPLPGTQVPFDRKKKRYLTQLPTRGLTPGVWRVDVTVEDDGTVHSAHLLLKGK